jgi:hypothetical protein
MGSRNVPVQVPPCQMLNTAIPVSAYQLRRMLRELPRTSKKTSPSRGSGAASDTEMLAMVTPSRTVVQFVQSIARRPRAWPSRGGRSWPARAAACPGRSPHPGSRKISPAAPRKKCRPAVRGRRQGGIIVRRLSLPPSFGARRLSGTPSFGEHRLVGQASVTHQPPAACKQRPQRCLRARQRAREARGNSTTPSGVSPCNGSYRVGVGPAC